MRIISGEFGGRKLIGPKDDTTTRPITDRVKQAVFDKLKAYNMLEGGQVVDLFSGTGSMGLEALSRGSAFCVFVDQDKDAINRLNQNLEKIQIEDRAAVHVTSVGSMMWTHGLATRGPIQVAFLDPPYALMEEDGSHGPFCEVMTALLPYMDPTGVALLRVPKEVDPLPVPGWRGPKIDGFGSMKVAYFAPERIAESESSEEA